ncbi:transcriptional regulator ATRX [Procambarus clarkii]|uniref:transcriptional regulator ATRX n=1 Tax=Procambarus clarkii TaxID=6728 RepID=UPI00374455F0
MTALMSKEIIFKSSFLKNEDFVLQVPIKSGDEVYLTNVDGDGMIWLQREADTSVLMQLDEKIEEYSSELKSASKIEIGLLYIVKSLQYDWFYRASVQNISEQEVEVLFIDFGSRETITSSQVFEMPEELEKMEPIAYKCILDCESASDAQTIDWNILYESNCNQVLSVKFVNSFGDTSIVQLFNKGKNVACFHHVTTSNLPEKPQLLEDFLMQDNEKGRSNIVTNNSLESLKIPEATVDANTGEEFQGYPVYPKFDSNVVVSADGIEETETCENIKVEEEISYVHVDKASEFQESPVYPKFDSNVVSADGIEETETFENIKVEEEISYEHVDQASGEFQESPVYPKFDSNVVVSADGIEDTETFENIKVEEEISYEHVDQASGEFQESPVYPKFDSNVVVSADGIEDTETFKNIKVEEETSYEHVDKASEFQESPVYPKFDSNVSVGDIEEMETCENIKLEEISYEQIDQASGEFQDSSVHLKFNSHKNMPGEDVQETEIFQSLEFQVESSNEHVDQASGEEFQESSVYVNFDSDEDMSAGNMLETENFPSIQFEEEFAEESITRATVDVTTDDEFSESLVYAKVESNEDPSANDVQGTVKLQNIPTEINTASVEHGTADLACDLESGVDIKDEYIRDVSGDLSIKSGAFNKFTQVQLKHVSENSESNKAIKNNMTKKTLVDVGEGNHFDENSEVCRQDYCSMLIERRVGNLSEVGIKQFKYDEVEEKIYVKYIEQNDMPLKQLSHLQTEQEVDDMDLIQSSPLQTEQEGDDMDLKRSSPLQTEQEGDDMDLKRSSPLQTEQEGDDMDLKRSSPLQTEQEGDDMDLKRSSPLQTEQEGDDMDLKRSSPLQTEQEGDDMDLKRSSPLQTEQEGDDMDLKRSSPLQTEQEGDDVDLKQLSPLQTEQEGDDMDLKRSSPLQTEQEGDDMDLKRSSPLQTEQEGDDMDLKRSSPLQTEQGDDVDLKQFSPLQTEQEVDVDLKWLSPLQTEQDDDVDLKQLSPLQTEQEDDMDMKQLSPLQTEQEGDDMDLKWSSPLQTEQEDDMHLKQLSSLQTEQEDMDLKWSSPLQTEQEGDELTLEWSSPLQTEREDMDLKQLSPLQTEQEDVDLKQLSPLQTEQERDVHLKQLSSLQTEQEGDDMDLKWSSPLQTEQEDVDLKQLSSLQTEQEGGDMDLKRLSPLQTEQEGGDMDLKQLSPLQTEQKGLKSQYPLTNGAAVYISFLNGDRVWLQRPCDADKLCDMSRRIITLVNNTQVPSNISKGKIYLAQYEDQTWYRAIILEVLEDHVFACFIDYGNSDVISNQQVREIPEGLLEDGPFAYECILKEQAVFVEDVPSPSLLETYLDKELTVAFVDAEMKSLTLKCDGLNILEDCVVLELISSLDQVCSEEGLGTCIEQLHNKRGTERDREQLCTEEETKFSQEWVCNGDGSVSTMEQAPSISLKNRNKRESSRLSGINKENLCNKGGFKEHSQQFSSETKTRFAFPERKQREKVDIDRSVRATMPIHPIPRSRKLAVEALYTCRKIHSKTALQAIEEVEENETTDISELKIKPFFSLLVHVEEFPFCLWIQKKEDMDLADYISTSLIELGDNLELLDAPQVDLVCVSLLCSCYQRAQVLALTSDTATLHFIDHGKYGTVTLKHLWKLPDEFLDIPPLVSQIFLPVKVIPGRESGAVLAVAEAALHSMCACLDLDLVSSSSRITHTLVSAPGVGELGELLVNNELARPINWGKKFELEMALSVKRLLKESTNQLCNDSQQDNLLLVTSSIQLNEKLNKLAKDL